MVKRTVRDVSVRGRRVLVRADFNVPFDERSGDITDDGRIQATLPTLRYLIDHGARVVLASHLGRPKGRVDEGLRMGRIAGRLSVLLGREVAYATDSIGADPEAVVASLRDGDVAMLENLRFHPGEEKGDPDFARALARLADIYVNDAFGTSHRSHASIVGVAEYLPAVAGLLLEKELETLGGILEDPAHPFAALLGGAKVSDKVRMIENIMGKVDHLLIGGGMAATFIKARGGDVGLSLVEEDLVDTARTLIGAASAAGVDLMLPVDVVVAGEISHDAEGATVSADGIAPGQRIVDIGPETARRFGEVLGRCRTVFWNGPMGIHEIPQFAAGTRALARTLADIDATTIIGGGSTAEAVADLGLADKMTFVSTGGGASLRFLGGEVLPGVAALLDKE